VRRLIGLLAFLFGLAVYTAAQAQSGPLIIDRGRPDRAPAAGAASPSTPAAGSVQTTPQGFQPFVFRKLDVRGSTLPANELEAAAKPFLGRTMGREEIAKLADAVGAVYARSDVALYTVVAPQQTFADGVVRIQAIEGRISDVVIAPARGPTPTLTAAYAEDLKTDGTLLKSRLERQVGLMRDIPGAEPDIRFLTGRQPGEVQLSVAPKLKPYGAALSVNNRGVNQLGRTQVELDLFANGLTREGDRTDLILIAPTDVERFQYYGAAHRQPIGDEGTAVSVNVGYLHTRPKIQGFELTGHATSAGATVTHPLIRRNTRSLIVTAGLDGLNSDNALFGQLISREHTRALRFAAAYTTQSPRKATSVSATLSQGLDGLGARMANPVLSTASFTKTNLRLNHTVVFDEKIVVRAAATAQITTSKLPASEKFAVGGAQYGRAFASAVVVGDSGYAESLELALRRSPKAAWLANSEVYAFADHGRVIQSSKRLFPVDDSIASAGAGVRLAFSKRAVAELECAKPLNAAKFADQKRGLRLMLNLRSTI
jgi:hemolysin activation/secretion protein